MYPLSAISGRTRRSSAPGARLLSAESRACSPRCHGLDLCGIVVDTAELDVVLDAADAEGLGAVARGLGGGRRDAHDELAPGVGEAAEGNVGVWMLCATPLQCERQSQARSVLSTGFSTGMVRGPLGQSRVAQLDIVIGMG